jgi:hypothetical protein
MRIANHAKNLIFGDAQAYQTNLFMLVAMDPKNCALYADSPERFNLQQIIVYL